MPKRVGVKRHNSQEVQGEGSYVVVTGVKVKEIRRIRQQTRDAERERARHDVLLKEDPLAQVPEVEYDEFESGLALLASHIVDWNWVDDEGDPLPLPKDDPAVVEELTNEESEFLIQLLMGEPKN